MDENQLYLGLGRVEGKIDLLLSNQARTEARLDDCEARLKSLEETRVQSTTVVSALSRIAGWYWALLGAALGTFGDDIKEYLFR